MSLNKKMKLSQRLYRLTTLFVRKEEEEAEQQQQQQQQQQEQ